MPYGPIRSIKPQKFTKIIKIHKKLSENQNKSSMNWKEPKKSEKALILRNKSRLSYKPPKK